jgi:aldehyde dehydrogenase (NAD+)
MLLSADATLECASVRHGRNRVEIFGPVLVAMTFRTPDEAVMLANNTRYGLAASVWSETIGLALDIAPKLMAGVVWVNGTNLFDASVGFGGYRESGFGREGGREGMYEYLKPKAWSGRKVRAKAPLCRLPPAPAPGSTCRRSIAPQSCSSAASRCVRTAAIRARCSRRRAAARRGRRGQSQGHPQCGGGGARCRVVGAGDGAQPCPDPLLSCRESVARGDEFARRLADMTGASAAKARIEVDASIERLFSYGAWADKFEGSVHAPPLRGVALAMHEPIGVVGVACPDEAPLLAFVSAWSRH